MKSLATQPESEIRLLVCEGTEIDAYVADIIEHTGTTVRVDVTPVKSDDLPAIFDSRTQAIYSGNLAMQEFIEDSAQLA